MKNTKLQDNWKVNNLQYKSMNLNKLLTTLHIFKKKKKSNNYYQTTIDKRDYN